MNEDRSIRAALDRHWEASDANDFEAEHEIYHDDAVLDYPRIPAASCSSAQYSSVWFRQPNKKRFMVRRVLGAADTFNDAVLT